MEVCEFFFEKGTVITGKISGHPTFKYWIRTSLVLNVDEDQIETLNSRYTLVGEGEGTFIKPNKKYVAFLLDTKDVW